MCTHAYCSLRRPCTMIVPWLAQKAEKSPWGWDESSEFQPQPFGQQTKPSHLRRRQRCLLDPAGPGSRCSQSQRQICLQTRNTLNLTSVLRTQISPFSNSQNKIFTCICFGAFKMKQNSLLITMMCFTNEEESHPLACWRFTHAYLSWVHSSYNSSDQHLTHHFQSNSIFALFSDIS